jgi:hypothetical protein
MLVLILIIVVLLLARVPNRRHCHDGIVRQSLDDTVRDGARESRRSFSLCAARCLGVALGILWREFYYWSISDED